MIARATGTVCLTKHDEKRVAGGATRRRRKQRRHDIGNLSRRQIADPPEAAGDSPDGPVRRDVAKPDDRGHERALLPVVLGDFRHPGQPGSCLASPVGGIRSQLGPLCRRLGE